MALPGRLTVRGKGFSPTGYTAIGRTPIQIGAAIGPPTTIPSFAIAQQQHQNKCNQQANRDKHPLFWGRDAPLSNRPSRRTA